MKIKIDRKAKIIVVVIIPVIMCILGMLLYSFVKIPKEKVENRSLYWYNYSGGVNYKVIMKPNTLYKNRIINEGQTYITSYVDNIKAIFNFAYSGDSMSDIRGSYQIIGRIEGYNTEKETAQTVWKREYPIISETSFSTKNKGYSLSKEVTLKLNDYNNFVNKITQDSKIILSNKFTAIMKIKFTVRTDAGIVEKEISPEIVVPLNASYFEIAKNNTSSVSDSIKGNVKVRLPVDKRLAIIVSVIIGMLALFLILFCIFTTGIIVDKRLVKNIKKIFRQHGNRLVAIYKEIKAVNEDCNEVREMDDLVKIADEICKPILYTYSEDYKSLTKYYVIDNEKIYVFDLANFMGEKTIIKDKSELEQTSDIGKEINS